MIIRLKVDEKMEETSVNVILIFAAVSKLLSLHFSRLIFFENIGATDF